jgi:hypothetical protein
MWKLLFWLSDYVANLSILTDAIATTSWDFHVLIFISSLACNGSGQMSLPLEVNWWQTDILTPTLGTGQNHPYIGLKSDGGDHKDTLLYRFCNVPMYWLSSCQTARTDFNVDQGASRCVLGNSRSDIETKRWSRLEWRPLVPTLKRGGMQGGGRCHNSVKTSIFKILFMLSTQQTTRKQRNCLTQQEKTLLPILSANSMRIMKKPWPEACH